MILTRMICAVLSILHNYNLKSSSQAAIFHNFSQFLHLNIVEKQNPPSTSLVYPNQIETIKQLKANIKCVENFKNHVALITHSEKLIVFNFFLNTTKCIRNSSYSLCVLFEKKRRVKLLR